MSRRQILIRVTEETHKKLRYLGYKKEKSITAVVEEILSEALKDIEVE